MGTYPSRPPHHRTRPKVKGDEALCLRCDCTFIRRIRGDKTERICQRCKKNERETEGGILHNWQAWDGGDSVW